jgi:iron complex outermembrane receptor protein
MTAHTRRTGARPKTRHLLMCCTTLVALPIGAYAQDENDGDGEIYRLAPILIDITADADDDANSVVAQEISVGGKVATSILDTPASISVVTAQEMQQRQVATTEEVLQYTPGILTDYYGSDDRNDYFQIRGFDATTYRDGMTLGSMRGVREEPYAYERVEVLRGSNSTLFGTADPGGSVNFVSKKPTFDTFADSYLTYGSHDHKEIGVDVGDVLNAEGTLAYRFTGKVKESALDYDYSQDDETFLMGGLSWQPSDYTELSLIVDYLKREGTPNSGGYPLDQDYDRSDFFGEPDFNYHDVERTSITGLLTHDFGGGLSLNANLRYSDLNDDFGYIYLYDYAGRTGTELSRYYFGTDQTAEELIGNAILKYETQLGTIDSSTVAGVEYRDASTTSSGIYGLTSSIDIDAPVYSGAPSDPYVYSDGESDYTTKSIFLTQNLSFDDRIIATFGMRHDWLDLSENGTSWGVAYDNSDDFSETSYRGALTYKVTDEISTYASYVQSVAPPSIGVEPERGEQYEIGVKYAPVGMNALFSAAIYDLTRENVTIAVVQGDGSIERQTIGESRVRGLDLEAKAELSEQLSLIASYSYLKSKVVEDDDENIIGNEFASTPNHIASIWGTYTVPGDGARGDMTFGLGARYVGSYYFNAANSAESDAATLFDASFGYEIAENTDLELHVSNLFDEQHVVGTGTANYYNPGRDISLTLRKSW